MPKQVLRKVHALPLTLLATIAAAGALRSEATSHSKDSASLVREPVTCEEVPQEVRDLVGPTAARLVGPQLASQLAPQLASQLASQPAPQLAPQLIQIALCLDTSGSMEGLIESAKQKLWAIVNDLAIAEPAPRLQVALLTFGNDGHLAENGWVHLNSPLTSDLDALSEGLFELTTNGGSEYVARVLHRSESLDWEPAPGVLKLTVVAGNESSEQDPLFSSADICRSLEARGIIVNAIYCGSAEDDTSPGWRNVAALTGGAFANIDQNDGLVVVDTPFDERLALLSSSLNATYIPFGTEGALGLENQSAQDDNAGSLGVAAAAARGCAKASGLYSCSWDLVDAFDAEKIDLRALEAKDLPEEMRQMSSDERVDYVKGKKAERGAVQEEIADLGRERDSFIRAEIARKGIDESLSFDAALRAAIRRQAEAKGFAFRTDDETFGDSLLPQPIVSLAPTSAPATPSKAPGAAVTNGSGLMRSTGVMTSISPASPATATATTTASLVLPAMLRAEQVPGPLVVRLDPARHDVIVSAVDILFSRADDVRAGNSGDLRRIRGGQNLPGTVVTIGSNGDWELLGRLIGSAEGPEATRAEVWIEIGARSYLVQVGC